MRSRLATIDATIDAADPMSRLQMVQERMDLVTALEAAEQKVDMTELEAAFIEAAADYGARKKISYAAWREVGVSAAVLKRAGISRAS